MELTARSAALALALALSTPLSAQEAGSAGGESSTQARVVGALVGATTGFVVGGVIGYWATSGPGYTADTKGEGFLVGCWIGSAILSPVAAHLFDERRGSPWPGLAAATAVTAVTLATDSGPFELSLPLLQILSGVVLGRARRP